MLVKFLNSMSVKTVSVMLVCAAAVGAPTFAGFATGSWQDYVHRACIAIVGLGAAHGILSTGNQNSEEQK